MSQHNRMLTEKWGPILDHEKFEPVKDHHRRAVTATILENTEIALSEDRQGVTMTSMLSEAAPVNSAGTGGFGGDSAAAGPTAGGSGHR